MEVMREGTFASAQRIVGWSAAAVYSYLFAYNRSAPTPMQLIHL